MVEVDLVVIVVMIIVVSMWYDEVVRGSLNDNDLVDDFLRNAATHPPEPEMGNPFVPATTQSGWLKARQGQNGLRLPTRKRTLRGAKLNLGPP